MVLDSSALVAILLREHGWEELLDALEANPCHLSAGTLAEAGIVLESRGGIELGRDLDDLLADAEAEIVPVTAERALRVREAYRRFGKGRHAAGLNFGDCFAYALARERGEPLLFVGDDFGLTDIGDALAS